jgi:hypothetical protein
LRATGPRTEAGKRRAAENGRATQKGEKSSRQLRAELAPILALAGQMVRTRGELDGFSSKDTLRNHLDERSKQADERREHDPGR